MRHRRSALGTLLLYTAMPLVYSQAGYDFDTHPLPPPPPIARGYQPPPLPAAYDFSPVPSLPPRFPPSVRPDGSIEPPRQPSRVVQPEPVNVVIHVFLNEKSRQSASTSPSNPSPPSLPSIPAHIMPSNFHHSSMPLTFTRDFDRDRNRFIPDDEEEQEGPANIVEVKAVVDSSDAAMDMRIGKAMARELDKAVPVVMAKINKNSELNDHLKSQLEQELIEEISRNLGESLETVPDVTEGEIDELVEEGFREFEKDKTPSAPIPSPATRIPSPPPSTPSPPRPHASQPPLPPSTRLPPPPSTTTTRKTTTTSRPPPPPWTRPSQWTTPPPSRPSAPSPQETQPPASWIPHPPSPSQQQQPQQPAESHNLPPSFAPSHEDRRPVAEFSEPPSPPESTDRPPATPPVTSPSRPSTQSVEWWTAPPTESTTRTKSTTRPTTTTTKWTTSQTSATTTTRRTTTTTTQRTQPSTTTQQEATEQTSSTQQPSAPPDIHIGDSMEYDDQTPFEHQNEHFPEFEASQKQEHESPLHVSPPSPPSTTSHPSPSTDRPLTPPSTQSTIHSPPSTMHESLSTPSTSVPPTTTSTEVQTTSTTGTALPSYTTTPHEPQSTDSTTEHEPDDKSTTTSTPTPPSTDKPGDPDVSLTDLIALVEEGLNESEKSDEEKELPPNVDLSKELGGIDEDKKSESNDQHAEKELSKHKEDEKTEPSQNKDEENREPSEEKEGENEEKPKEDMHEDMVTEEAEKKGDKKLGEEEEPAGNTTFATPESTKKTESHEELPFEGKDVWKTESEEPDSETPGSECPTPNDPTDSSKVDVVFLLDSSSAFEEKMFKGAVDLIANTTSRFKNIGPQGVQVSLVQFSDEPHLEFSLRRHSCLAHLLDDIRDTQHLQGMSMLGKAFDKSARLAFTRERGDRADAEDVLIVVTDGASDDKVQLPVNFNRGSGMGVVVISTLEADPDVVMELAGSADNVFHLESDIHEPLAAKLAHRILSTAEGKYPTEKPKIDLNEDGEKENQKATTDVEEKGTTTEITTTTAKSAMDSMNSSSIRLSCTKKDIGVTVDVPGSFAGYLVVEGQREKENCTIAIEKSVEKTRKVHFHFGLEACDVARVESESPVGLNSSAVVSLVHHKKAVSVDDKAFLVECFVASQSETTLDAELEVVSGKKMIAEAVSLEVVPPTCRYSIRKESPEGTKVEKATLGEVVFHRWDCDGGDEAYDVYGMFIHDCFAGDDVMEQFPIIDKDGCTSNPRLLTQPVYAEGALSVYGESRAFAVEDDSLLKFRCKVSLCTRDGDGCEGMTPPQCSNSSDLLVSRRSRHNAAVDSALTSAVATSVGLTTASFSRYSSLPIVAIAIILAVVVGLVGAVRLNKCRGGTTSPIVTSSSLEDIYVSASLGRPSNAALAEFMKTFDRSRYV